MPNTELTRRQETHLGVVDALADRVSTEMQTLANDPKVDMWWLTEAQTAFRFALANTRNAIRKDQKGF